MPLTPQEVYFAVERHQGLCAVVLCPKPYWDQYRSLATLRKTDITGLPESWTFHDNRFFPQWDVRNPEVLLMGLGFTRKDELLEDPPIQEPDPNIRSALERILHEDIFDDG